MFVHPPRLSLITIYSIFMMLLILRSLFPTYIIMDTQPYRLLQIILYELYIFREISRTPLRPDHRELDRQTTLEGE